MFLRSWNNERYVYVKQHLCKIICASSPSRKHAGGRSASPRMLGAGGDSWRESQKALGKPAEGSASSPRRQEVGDRDGSGANLRSARLENKAAGVEEVWFQCLK